MGIVTFFQTNINQSTKTKKAIYMKRIDSLLRIKDLNLQSSQIDLMDFTTENQSRLNVLSSQYILLQSTLSELTIGTRSVDIDLYISELIDQKDKIEHHYLELLGMQDLGNLKRKFDDNQCSVSDFKKQHY